MPVIVSPQRESDSGNVGSLVARVVSECARLRLTLEHLAERKTTTGDLPLSRRAVELRSLTGRFEVPSVSEGRR